jgi:hypothetical protein
MSHKKKGHLTTSGEWKKHLRPYGKREFHKGERAAARRVSARISKGPYLRAPGPFPPRAPARTMG